VSIDPMIPVYEEEIRELKSERDRFAAALWRIVKSDYDSPGHYGEWCGGQCADVARTALREETKL
jgi:hypothetical protein